MCVLLCSLGEEMSREEEEEEGEVEGCLWDLFSLARLGEDLGDDLQVLFLHALWEFLRLCGVS